MAKKPKIVVAAGSAQAGSKGPSKAIADAMAKATLDAMAEGITDADEIKRRKLAARDLVKGVVRVLQ